MRRSPSVVYWLPVLFISLAGCQRASYSFQPIGGRLATPGLRPPADTSAAPIPFAEPQQLPAGTASRPVRGHRLRLPPAVRRPGTRPPSLHLRWPSARQPPHSAAAQNQAGAEPVVRHRSRVIAIILAALSLTYLPLSLHNFYLGYYGRGAAAIALFIVGLYLALLGSVGLVFGPPSLTAVGYISVILLGAWFLWQLTDLVRIITGDLKPKNGSYTKSMEETP